MEVAAPEKTRRWECRAHKTPAQSQAPVQWAIARPRPRRAMSTTFEHTADALAASTHWPERLCRWLVLTNALLVAAIVLLRLLLGSGSIAAQEGVIYLHAATVSVALASTWRADGHVRVDIFSRRFGARGALWLEAFGTQLLALPLALFLLAASLPYAVAAWQTLEGSADAGGLPGVYLVKTLIPVSAALLVAQALARWLVAMRALVAEPQAAPRKAAPRKAAPPQTPAP